MDASSNGPKVLGRRRVGVSRRQNPGSSHGAGAPDTSSQSDAEDNDGWIIVDHAIRTLSAADIGTRPRKEGV
jgi:hypothetical protein